MSFWKEVRRDFPVLERQVYLDSAAAGPSPRIVRETVDQFYRELEEGGDNFWDEWVTRIEDVRARAARLVNADPDEIGFVQSTSAGMNVIVDMFGDAGPMLTSELEFPAVTLPWVHRGVEVTFIPPDDGLVLAPSPGLPFGDDDDGPIMRSLADNFAENIGGETNSFFVNESGLFEDVNGVIDFDAFAPDRAPGAATITLSHVQYSNGCRQDLIELGKRKAGRNLVVCGSQAAGVFPVDVRAAQIDAYVTTGHKWLCAGYGNGFMYTRRELIEKSRPHGVGWMSVAAVAAPRPGTDPRAPRYDNQGYRLLPGNLRSELGSPAFPPIFALGAALGYFEGVGASAIEARVLELGAYLRDELESRGFEVLSPGGAHRSGQTLCALDDPSGAVGFLRECGIIVTHKPEGVRISTHFFNSEEDIDRCVAALRAHRGR